MCYASKRAFPRTLRPAVPLLRPDATFRLTNAELILLNASHPRRNGGSSVTFAFSVDFFFLFDFLRGFGRPSHRKALARSFPSRFGIQVSHCTGAKHG